MTFQELGAPALNEAPVAEQARRAAMSLLGERAQKDRERLERIPRFRLEVGAHADANTPNSRKSQEDTHFVSPDIYFPVFMVSDGMGGEGDGDVASKKVLEQFENARKSGMDPKISPKVRLQNVIQTAQDKLVERKTQNPPISPSAGATVIAAEIRDKLYLANVGDSLAFQYDPENVLPMRGYEPGHRIETHLSQLNRPHDVEEVQRGKGNRTTKLESSPIYRAIGADPKVDHETYDLHPGQVLLLCSDGLTSLPEGVQYRHTIETILAQVSSGAIDPNSASRRLVQFAIDSGSRDNITALVIKVNDNPEFHAAQKSLELYHRIDTARENFGKANQELRTARERGLDQDNPAAFRTLENTLRVAEAGFAAARLPLLEKMAKEPAVPGTPDLAYINQQLNSDRAAVQRVMSLAATHLPNPELYEQVKTNFQAVFDTVDTYDTDTRNGFFEVIRLKQESLRPGLMESTANYVKRLEEVVEPYLIHTITDAFGREGRSQLSLKAREMLSDFIRTYQVELGLSANDRFDDIAQRIDLRDHPTYSYYVMMKSVVNLAEYLHKTHLGEIPIIYGAAQKFIQDARVTPLLNPTNRAFDWDEFKNETAVAKELAEGTILVGSSESRKGRIKKIVHNTRQRLKDVVGRNRH